MERLKSNSENLKTDNRGGKEDLYGWRYFSEPKLPKRTKAQLEASETELENFKKNSESYQDDKESHDEYILEKKKREELEALKFSKYPEHYHDWQIECLETIKDESNVILSSPTGSGKTTVFLDWAKEKKEQAEKEGETGHTVYITAPIKALSNQRFRELKDAGLKVGIMTGDAKSVPDDAEIICCTQEIYTNRYADDENATLVVDEFHYIFEDNDRQRAYIDGIHESKAKNMLLCSATFGDVDKLDSYVEKVTGRQFKAYENHERLTDLYVGGKVKIEDIKDALVIAFSVNNCKDIAETLLIERKREEFTINENDGDYDEKEISQEELRFKKPVTEQITSLADSFGVSNSELIKLAEYGIATYYGGMLPKEKKFVESAFENRLIDTVVGTDALALGVNFPVKEVVFAQLDKYRQGTISKNLFDQLAGRAGRKGYYDEGAVGYCDDFYNRRGYCIGDDVEYLFSELVNSENESVKIELTPRIKKILSGEVTIEEEAEYIAKYSTEETGEERVLDEISSIIREITEFDPRVVLPLNEQEELYRVEQAYLLAEKKWDYEDDVVRVREGNNRVFYRDDGVESRYVDIYDPKTGKENRYVLGLNLDGEFVFDPQTSSHNTGVSPEEVKRIIELMTYARSKRLERAEQLKKEYEELRRNLLGNIEEEYLEEIQYVYSDELSVEENCCLCAGLVAGRRDDIFGKEDWDWFYYDEPGDKIRPLIDLGGNEFKALCRKRQIIMNLPRKYREGFDIVELEKQIRDIDNTLLDEDMLTTKKISIQDIKNEIIKEKSA